MTSPTRGTRLALALLTCAAPATSQQPDRSRPPELGPPPPLSLPVVQELRLSNGLRVMLMEKRQVPVVQVNVLVRVGAAHDPDGKAGLASLTADMMDEGAGTRDGLTLADAMDFLGARVRVEAGMHAVSATLYTPVARLGDALPLLADIVLRPTFSQDELERTRRSQLTQLAQWRRRPSYIASALFTRALYGDRHPYGRYPLPYGWPPLVHGDPASLGGIEVADLRAFHDAHFVANNAVIIVVGATTPSELLAKLEPAFGEWRTGTVPTPAWPEVRQVRRTEVLLVDVPGASQSVIRIGRVGAPRRTEDYFALTVMNTVLASRLYQNLREDKGYTYGASSEFGTWHLAGPFHAQALVRTDATAAALREFFREFRGILEPVPAEELTRARNADARRFPGTFGSVSDIARNLADLASHELPSDYFNRYVERTLAVTPRDVQQAARKYVVPGAMLVVVVGDRATIEREIHALRLGPVRILSVEDVLGPQG